jgi:1-deoxy-D-xylulose-5-phosphate synthase
MPTGSSLNIMMKEIPERIFDVGIAEQHAVTFSAGLAIEGILPFCNIYSSFMQRAYDQVIHDVAIQNLNVIFCLDRGGIVGEDGATHHGVFDLAYLRCIPNMIVSAPLNEEELRNLMYTAQLEKQGPFAIRYPRGKGVMPDWKTPFKKIVIGKGQQITKGEDIAILSIGHVGNYVIEATRMLTKNYQISIAHYDMRFVKPVDEEILHTVGKNFKALITIEDGTVVGGFGSAVLEFMSEHGYHPVIKRMGVPDRFIEQGTLRELHHECGFDVQGIIKEVKALTKPNILSNVG